VIEWTDFAWGSTTIDIRQCSPRIANNTILDSGLRGIQVIGPGADPVIENNTIRTQLLAENRTFNQWTGIITQDANPVIRNNTLTDNYFGIYVYLGGQPRIENNTIRNGWVGLLVLSSSPVVAHNLIEGNGLAGYGGTGVLLSDSAVTLRDNVIRNNGVGVDVPYNSKETLPLSRGNVVNGVPMETFYRYRARDVVIARADLDSGRSFGFTGNATEQGLLTLYDSVNVTVRRARLRNNVDLVFAANSTAAVENSTLTNSSNDFFLMSVSQIVSLNNDFRMHAVNITDTRSTLTIKNFLHVRTISDGAIPIAGVDVRVTQDGADIARRRTDSGGSTGWIPAAYGILSRVQDTIGPPDLSLSRTEVAVTRPPLAFIGTPRIVNMSATHTETFVQTDATPPRVLEAIPAPNSVGVPFGSRITIVFSEPMNRTATEAAITVVGYHLGDFMWTPDGDSVSFSITDARYGETYFVAVRDTARDLAGNRLATTYLFAFDVEHAPRRVDLTPVWAASLAILVAGLLAVLWRSRSRAKALREEQGDPEEKPQG
jgi:parallel beta-helix repeat protein